jgi:hypothetical protein
VRLFEILYIAISEIGIKSKLDVLLNEEDGEPVVIDTDQIVAKCLDMRRYQSSMGRQ